MEKEKRREIVPDVGGLVVDQPVAAGLAVELVVAAV
jgi:hypothetical protein